MRKLDTFTFKKGGTKQMFYAVRNSLEVVARILKTLNIGWVIGIGVVKIFKTFAGA